MKPLAILVSLLALAACGPTYHESLDQKLLGKSPDERRAILSQECARQAEGPPERSDPRYAPHIESMKRICEEATRRP
jgi:hypothetical protein